MKELPKSLSDNLAGEAVSLLLKKLVEDLEDPSAFIEAGSSFKEDGPYGVEIPSRRYLYRRALTSFLGYDFDPAHAVIELAFSLRVRPALEVWGEDEE